ncbi:unnamed protein product [Leptosia nina]|uniref:Calcitonin receptor n=1 Tax=Leptosia nina TaxID=320188 RepID=A0AAV1K076_9NEOP
MANGQFQFNHQYQFDKFVKAMDACSIPEENNSTLQSIVKFCSRLFDGYQCWNATPAGTIVTQNCPSYVQGFDETKLTQNMCDDNGTWLGNPIEGKDWTNYAGCYDPTILMVSCQFFHVAMQYMLLTGYMWLFCHSLCLRLALAYLHVRLKDSIPLFNIIGWFCPLFITAVYVIVRGFYYQSTDHCWTDESNAIYFISVPVWIAIISSLVMLLNIVTLEYYRILRTPSQARLLAVVKAAQQTLILVPLFGLHFGLIPMHPYLQPDANTAYQIATFIITILQALALAVIFCFKNVDIVQALNERQQRRQEDRDIALPAIERGRKIRAVVKGGERRGGVQETFL